ncbi:MAG: DUF123 domain-containing protein, partial [Acidilobaceae archaeon]
MTQFNSYILLLDCPNLTLKTRARTFEISEGVYAYVGSCGVSCCKRVFRHYTEKKKMFWHIDYLTVRCRKLGFYLLKTPETEVSNYLAKSLRGVHGFGSSDDKRVSSHLFRVQEDFNLFLSKL